jgi:uncharacterized protein (DUF1015 family)
MATVKPFRALRPVPQNAYEVACVPYDVVNTREAKALAAGKPFSFLHVTRPDIDLPDETDPFADEVYAKAEENLAKFKKSGVLVQEEHPSLYIYRLGMNSHEQYGIAVCCSVDEYDHDLIRKHEHTRKRLEDDRLRLMLSLSAHTGPVLMTYRGTETIDRFVEHAVSTPALYDFTADDGVQHTIWKVVQAAELSNAFQEVPLLYIADGHHRAMGASRLREEILRCNPGGRDSEEFNYFLSVLFPAEQLCIFPYNRYVRDLNGMNNESFIKTIQEKFRVSVAEHSMPSKKGQFGMYLAGKWYMLQSRHTSSSGEGDPVSRLDLSHFQREILETILGVVDQKVDGRIEFIGGEESVDRLKKRVDTSGGVAFTLFPVSVEELLAVADAKLIMPPKSTWFAPKLRSGLLIHTF